MNIFNRSVSQLFFETIPQVIVQAGLVFGLFNYNLNKFNGITENDVYISIGTAIVNSIAQIGRIYIEAKACNESFVGCGVTCLLARIGWIPFIDKIEKIVSNATTTHNSDKDDDCDKFDNEIISYDIKYDYPLCVTKLFKVRGQVRYDFSSITINYKLCFDYYFLFYLYCVYLNQV